MLVPLLVLRLTGDDALALLSQSIAAYRQLASYADEGVRQAGRTTTRFRTWYRRGAGMRAEWEGPLRKEVTWTKGGYRFDFLTVDEPGIPRRTSRLSRKASDEIYELPSPSEGLGRWIPEILVKMDRRYDFRKDYDPPQNWIRKPSQTLNGVRCDVVGLEGSGSTYTVWLDRDTHLVRQIEQDWPLSSGKRSSVRTVIKPRPNAAVRDEDIEYRPPLTQPLPSLPLPPPGRAAATFSAPSARPQNSTGVIETVRRAFSGATTLTDEMERLGPELGRTSIALRDDGVLRYAVYDGEGHVRRADWSNATLARSWTVLEDSRSVTVVETGVTAVSAPITPGEAPGDVTAFGSRFFPSFDFLNVYRIRPSLGGPPATPDFFNRVDRSFEVVDTELESVPAWLVHQKVTSGYANHIGPTTSEVQVWLDRQTGLPLREMQTSHQNGRHRVNLDVRHHYRVNPPLRPQDFAFRPPSVDLWETLVERRDR